MPAKRFLGTLALVLLGALLAATVGVLLFGLVPEWTPLGTVQVVLVVLLAIVGVVIAKRIANSIFTDYDVAEVEVDDVITRDGDAGSVPLGGGGASADDIVEQIEQADEDATAEALIVKLNTPGGAVVPSEDIRKATADFDGPTVAYAEDMATSGGFWIASGADEFHARRGSLVGSIGVNGTQLGRKELADKVGLDYRRFVAGEYKDSFSAQWREMDDDEVEYVQGLLDGYYEQFVDTVVDGHDLAEDLVRDTEARIYLGETAHEMGLVDHCGPREEMEERLADELGVDEITVETFEPDRALTEKVGMGARSVARAFGEGVASVVAEDELELRI